MKLDADPLRNSLPNMNANRTSDLALRLITLLAIALLARQAAAQEIVPQEDLAKVVPRALARLADFDNLPLKTDAEGAKAFGMKIRNYAAVVIPDKGLTKEALAKASSQVLPIGQLWLSKLSPAVKDATTPNSRLRLVTLTIKEEDHRLPLLLLGVRKQADNRLELVVYAKDKEPLLALPLTKAGTKQEFPLEIAMRQGTTTLGLIDINILGEYQATLPVGEQQD